MSLLEIRDLHVSYGAINAVQGVSFSMGNREILQRSLAPMALESPPFCAPSLVWSTQKAGQFCFREQN